MNTSAPTTGHFDLDLYLERMERARVERAIAGVRRLEEAAGRGRIPQEVRDLHDELRRNMHEWAGL